MIDMGGVIGFTVREADGTEHRMQRWTNILPSIFEDPEFIRYGSDKQVMDLVKHWYTESAKGSQGNTIISTWEMYNYPYLAPFEYGIVVIDYLTRSIVSCNGYSSPSTVFKAPIKVMNLSNPIWTAGLILQKEGLLGKEILPRSDMYEIIHPFWSIYDYDDSHIDSFRRALAKIKELGFILTDKEEQIWKEYIER